MSDSEYDVPASRRRRPRTISGLTDQQLQHKRDVDRKAQRALRQRTKSKIQELERELTRFKNSHSEQEQHWLNELHELRDQNAMLKSQLKRISQLANAVRLLEGENVDSSPPTLEASNAGAGRSTHQPEIPPTFLASPSLSGAGRATHQPEMTSPTHTNDFPPATEENSTFLNHNQENPSSIGSGLNGDHYLDGQQENIPTADRVSNISAISPGASHITHASPASNNTSGRAKEVYTVLCEHHLATCPLDQILLDFLNSRRVMAAEGISLDVLAGPVQPLVSALLSPELAPTAHPLSRVMAEVLCTFPHVQIQEKLAFMYLMYGTMRWQIAPTKEKYMWLPSWLRPTAKQITTVHAAWIDNIPWPGVRDLLIEYPDKYPFVTFSEMYSHNVSVNWAYDPMDSVINTGDDSSKAILNPIFEKHIRRISNWTVSREFELCYPEMSTAIYSRD